MPLLSTATGIFFAGQGSSAFNQGGGGGGGGGSASADGWQANTVITNSSSGGGQSFGIRGIAGLSDGSVFVSGNNNADDIGYAMLIDTDGDVKWVTQLNANAYYGRFFSSSANGTSLFAAGTDYGWGSNEQAAGRTNVSASIAAKFAKTDGSVDWLKVIKKTSIGSANDGFDTSITNSVADSDGNLWILGRHRGSNNESNLHIAKINGSNGALMSMHKRTKSPDTKQDNIYGIKFDASGNIYLLWQVYDPNSSNSGVGVQKLNSSFVIQWTKMYSDTTYNSDRGYQFDLDSSGNVYVSGYTSQSPGSGTIAKLNTADGTIAWSKQLNTGASPGTGVSDIKGMVVDNDDNIWLCGPYDLNTPYNFVLTKYNSSGVIQNQWGIASSNGYTLYNSVNTMDIDSNGNILLGFRMYQVGSTRTSLIKLPAILEAGTFTDLVITDRTAVDYAYSPSDITHTTYSMSDVSSDFETADYNSGSYALLPAFTNTFTKDVDPIAGGSSGGGGGSSIAWGGDRGLSLFNGNTQIDYFDIATAGNALDFGDMLYSTYYISANISNGDKQLFTGGTSNLNNISYVTAATLNQCGGFSDMTRNNFGTANTSNGVRGIIAGGAYPPNDVGQGWDGIEYVTIDPAAHAVNFGDLAQSREHGSAVSDGTYAGICGGQAPAVLNNIDRITIATTGNATDFGDLTFGRRYLGGHGIASKCTTAGGENSTGYGDHIEEFTLDTNQNASNYGDLTVARQSHGVTGNKDYGVAVGGVTAGDGGGTTYDVIDRWSMSSSGNATDHGDLQFARTYGCATSGNAS